MIGGVLPELVTLPDGRIAQTWLDGTASGPLVVLLHGCPDTRHVAMTGDVAARAAGVRLLCVNRPGYGSSTAGPSTHGSVADDLVAVAEAAGAERFAVVGMSVGGAYAVALAARHPDRVRRLDLVATQAEGDSTEPVEVLVERFRPEFEDYVAQVRPDDPDDLSLAGRWLSLLPEPDAALLEAHGLPAVAASVRESLASPEGYLRDAAHAARPWLHHLDEVRCPVRLWRGELDDRATSAAGTALHARLPEAALVVHPATTHLATLLAHWPDVLA